LQFAETFGKNAREGPRFRLYLLTPRCDQITAAGLGDVRCERLRYSRESAAAITIQMMVKPKLRAANADSANPRLFQINNAPCKTVAEALEKRVNGSFCFVFRLTACWQEESLSCGTLDRILARDDGTRKPAKAEPISSGSNTASIPAGHEPGGCFGVVLGSIVPGQYSIQSTAGQALFLPTSREAKYKAKAAIDAFFKRFGDVLQAGIVYLGTSLGFALSAFAALNLGFTIIWIVIAAALSREYRRRSHRTSPKPAAVI